MRDPGLILSGIEHRRGIDTTYVVPIRGFILDDKTPKLNRTLEDVLAHDLVDFKFSRKYLKDEVVGLILLHIEIIFHGDIKQRSIVQCVKSWKLTDLRSSQKIGYANHNA